MGRNKKSGPRSTEAGARRRPAPSPEVAEPALGGESTPAASLDGEGPEMMASEAAETEAAAKAEVEAKAKADAKAEAEAKAEARAPRARPPIDGASSDAQGGPPPATPEPLVPRFPYSVAPGRAITSRRGMLGPGEEVRADFFLGGEETLATLVDKGVVLEA